MSEFLRLLPPDEALALLLSHLSAPIADSELIDTALSLGRVTAADIVAPHPLPEFPRSTVDGYVVRARDTFGATDSLPAYLNLIGEVPMGEAPSFELEPSQCALIHTGGMLPKGSDAVVMLEFVQPARTNEVEIMRAVAEGENVIRVGEDVTQGAVVLPKGRIMRPAEIGGLMALGILQLRAIRKIRVGIISSGDEIVNPSQQPRPGQVRDVNAYTLSSLMMKSGGESVMYGIVPDRMSALKETAGRALTECDVVLITAGSSASTRDMTAEVIGSLGAPGVLVHGINTRPGKPTILGACRGKAVVGLPGNPVSALVNGYLFVVPVVEKLCGLPMDKPRAAVLARVTVNIASQAGREDWVPVRIVDRKAEIGNWDAEPIFGKSNLIFTLASADGLLRIPADATGVSAGEMAEVMLL